MLWHQDPLVGRFFVARNLFPVVVGARGEMVSRQLGCSEAVRLEGMVGEGAEGFH